MSTEIHNPFFYFQGRRFEAIVGNRGPYGHFFGGETAVTIENQPEDFRGIHRVLTLDLHDPILSPIFPGLERLILFHGFEYDPADCEYFMEDSNRIKISKFDAKYYSANWPYVNYPVFFPSVPFVLTEPTACTLGEFSKRVWQGVKQRFENEFVAIVPPSDAYGVNLWHDKSAWNPNFDHIHVKFFVNPLTRRVETYNECD